MMWARWVSAVFVLILRTEATSLLVLPSARSWTISRSRAVSRWVASRSCVPSRPGNATGQESSPWRGQ